MTSSRAHGDVPADAAGTLRLDGICRSFGETVALDDVSLSIEPGTVHSILGENGSGKSTLVKILSGVLTADRGTVSLGGRRLERAIPRRARALGISTVFQEVLVAPNRSVTENVMLGMDRTWVWAARGQKRDAIVRDALAEISVHPFDPRAEVGTLTLLQQQQIAIARAFVSDPRILVLDESTAAMDVGESERLFDAVRRRVEAGLAVVFISHRMDEVLKLSDHVTVLRSGRRIATLARAEITETLLLNLLNGKAAA